MTTTWPEGFLADLAAGPPGPAAGSAAAVAAAMAAALCEMAARRSDDTAAAARAADLRARALGLAAEDAEAVTAVLAGGEPRGQARERALAAPRAVAAAAEEVTRLASELEPRVRRHLRPDVAAARTLGEAAAVAASSLAAVNAAAGALEPWSLARRERLGDDEVAWDVLGDGPPVVLVHGTPSWSYLWRKVAPALAETFTIYLLDLPGYGDSPPRRGGRVSIASHAETLAELLRRWDLDDPAVAGHDIGGGIALRAHLAHGARFRRIALVDAVVLAPWITPTTRHIQTHLDVYRTMPVHIFERVTAAHLATAVARGFDREAFEAYHAHWRGERGQAAYLAKVEQFDEEHTRELEPRLATIDVPVLVVWGAQDAWLDPAVARRLAERIPGAELTLIENAGHFSMEDAPAEVAQALADFLGEGGGADAV